MALFLDKTEHAVQHRLIREFDEDWYCYWDDSYGMPKNAVTDFVFRPALGISRTGIVTSTGASAAFLDALNAADESADAVVHAFKSKLAALAADLQTHGVSCSSESDYPLLPLLVPCAADLLSPLTPSAVLGVLGAHAELVQSVSKCALNDIISNDDDGDFQTRIETVLLVGQEGAQVLVFECGEDKLNPMPVLCVARLSPTLIGGFLTAKVCT